jgi:Asp-tRNA(Asn)/Glu-tRNA(Gln) amidotransferase A subunit family amidase
MPTTLGSALFRDYMPERDCFVVSKLKKAGVIFLGKATLGELGGGHTHGSLFGSTRNVYDLGRTAGGSSGGSGAGVSANFCVVAVGQEGLASIRRPASWNGVAGMRPTMGLVSRAGVYGGWPTTNGSLGPMARTVTDLAKLLDSMVGYDPDDPATAHGVGHVADSYSATLDRGALKGARLGILRESIGYAAEPDTEDFRKVSEVFDRAVTDLRKAGAEIVDPIVIPDLKALIARTTMPCLSFFSRAGRHSSPRARPAARLPQDARHVDEQPTEGHGRSSAGRHRPQGCRAPANVDQRRRQFPLCRPEGRPAPQYLFGVRAVDRRAGRIYSEQSAGGDHVPRTTARRRQHDSTRLRLRTGNSASASADYHAVDGGLLARDQRMRTAANILSSCES